jgi:DNA replication protein
MAYNKDNLAKIFENLAQRRVKAEEDAGAKRASLHAAHPEIAEIDRVLSQTGIKIFEASQGGSEGLSERIKKLRDENRALNQLRRETLAVCGYPEDYTDVKYTCPICSDTGYEGLKMCSCVRAALAMEGYKSSGIGNLMEKQSFQNFSLDFYADRDKEIMQNTLSRVKKFADNFGSGDAVSLLMFGATGLGKTHLSTAAAKVIIEKGYDVVYETAQNIFSDFEYQRFKSGYGETDDKTARYFDCDLLIIDDLGTEISNSFTVSCLYNIINTRINKGASVMINTNLTNDEILKRYADRITSRLFGEFSIMMFKGRDIRAQKLQ